MNKLLNSNLEINSELENARHARQNGNEGKARVCARRAAGMAIRRYFLKTSLIERKESALELIQIFEKEPGIPPEIIALANNLSLRVTQSFNLPEGVDLIVDAQRLCDYISNLIDHTSESRKNG